MRQAPWKRIQPWSSLQKGPAESPKQLDPIAELPTAPPELRQHPALHRLFRVYLYAAELGASDLAQYLAQAPLVPTPYPTLPALAGVIAQLSAGRGDGRFEEFGQWLLRQPRRSSPEPGCAARMVGLLALSGVAVRRQQLQTVVARWRGAAGRGGAVCRRLGVWVNSQWAVWRRDRLWWGWCRWEGALGQFREVRLIMEMERSRKTWEAKVLQVEKELVKFLHTSKNGDDSATRSA